MSTESISTEHQMTEMAEIITEAVNTGTRQYFEACRQRVPSFVKQHYSINGALRINRKAIGADLLRAPANLLWATPYLLSHLSRGLVHRAGLTKLSRRMETIPAGFKTKVQEEIEWLTFSELLMLPIEQKGRHYQDDALLAAILSQPALSERLIQYLRLIHNNTHQVGFEQALQQNLQSYSNTRVASADLAGGVITLAAGIAAFNKLTPGALSTGSLLAASIAQQSAISSFVFGPTLGSVYYGLFPVAASMGLVIASTGGILAALGIFAAVSGIITDPLQRRLGIHQRRLYKLIDSLELAFTQSSEGKFNPKDQYVARIFDLADVLKTAAGLK